MKKPISTVLFATGAVVIAATAYSQTSVAMKADIPFAFHAGTGTVPAGELVVSHLSPNIVSLYNIAERRNVFVVGLPNEPSAKSTPAVMFRCGADSCSLAAIRTPEGTVSYGSGRKRSNENVAVITVPLRAANGD
jgi:hypothetical protein